MRQERWISSTEATDEDRSTIKIYTGTFGGDAYGTWNGTLTSDRFYGTWSGTTPGGWWVGQDSTSGSWTVAEVDSNYDHHVPSSDDDSAYLANIILQAFENGVSLYNNNVEESDYGAIIDNGDGTGYSVGPTVSNITATAYFTGSDPDLGIHTAYMSLTLIRILKQDSNFLENFY